MGESSVGRATITGRCLAAENRRPIADVVVGLSGAGEVARSAADGTFRAEVALDARGAVTLRLDAADRATRAGSFAGLKDGSHEDLGDLLLPRGWRVRGRVIEVDGTGVGGNNVLVFGVDTALRAGQSSQGLAGAVSAADGSFTLDMQLPAGSYRAQVFGARRKQRGDGAFVVDPSRGTELLHLVLEPIEVVPAIRGTVVDARGAPVDGVRLRAESGSAPAQSDRLGRFALLADGPTTGTTRVLLQRPERWAATFAPPVVEWGREDVRIVLPDGPRVAVEVVDDAGAAVAEYAVLFGPADHQFLPENRACGRRHEDGRCEFSTSQRGGLLLRVVPTTDDLDCGELRKVELGAEELHRERFVLARLAMASVIVVDDAGGPVSDADVSLLRLGEDLEQARHRDRDPRSLRLHTLVDGLSERVGGGKTEADGRTSLRVPPRAQGLGLRVRAEGFVTELIVDPRLSSVAPLRVVLRRGGALRVEVERNGEPRELFAVVLWDAMGRPVSRIDGRIDAEGVCTVPLLPAGHYSVSVHRQLVLELPGEAVRRHAACGAPVVAVDVVGGATANVRIEVPRPSFGALDGRLVGPDFSGEVPHLLGVALVRLDAADLRIGFFPVAADGSFHAEGLLPGRYHIAVQNTALGELQSVKGLLDAVVEIEPGNTRSAEFACVRRRLQLRLRWPDGRPVAARVEYRCGTLTATHQGSGELVLDPAPELPIEVRVGESGEWSAPVLMPRDRTEAVVEVVVPAPR
ncbi:MAG: carboxypeptidase regulatory-like domain-containing protein [Planctomycetes bacterium]|nr:carboxypeptidase regulatory-like domain-containing protein [Planctomycetota bacterium]